MLQEHVLHLVQGSLASLTISLDCAEISARAQLLHKPLPIQPQIVAYRFVQ